MKRAKKAFQKYDQVFILQSSTNIDRLKGFYELSKETGKTFIMDIFTSNLVVKLHDKEIPNPYDLDDVYTWITGKYRRKKIEFQQEYVIPFKKRSKQKSYVNKKYCLLVKASMLETFKKLFQKNYIDNACLIYSMWDGYKEKEEMKTFLEEVKKYGVKEIIDYHTSGHADLKTIQLLNELHASKVIPIHTTNPKKLINVLNNTILIEDNDIIEV